VGDVTNRINLTPVALMEATCFSVSGVAVVCNPLTITGSGHSANNLCV
jgi:hypothetical protein